MNIAIKDYFPGILTCATIALASTFIADHYGGPVMLFALLFGTAFHFLNEDVKCQKGIDFCAKNLLRIGVALLGFRITFSELSAIGITPLLTTLITVFLAIAIGIVAAKLLKLSTFFAVLASCSVAICGASAALAIASILPVYKDKERDTIFVVVTVTALSTMAMIFYPVLIQYGHFSALEMSVFLGGTIHDVAQVVGAGYSISDEVGDGSAVIKLFRVALLVPVVIFFSLIFTQRNKQKIGGTGGEEPSLLATFVKAVPPFLIAFVIFVVVNSSGLMADSVTQLFSDVSRWLLVAAIAALGVKTSFQELGQVGIKPILVMLICTALIAAFVIVAIVLFV